MELYSSLSMHLEDLPEDANLYQKCVNCDDFGDLMPTYNGEIWHEAADLGCVCVCVCVGAAVILQGSNGGVCWFR